MDKIYCDAMVIAMAAYRPVSVIQTDLMEIKAAGQQPPQLRTFTPA
jgi:hypothetical protein